jgi:imidazolonepropionase-like amidohydrolase
MSSHDKELNTMGATRTLIKNVSIFNGTSETLISAKDVVLAGNKIEKLIPSGGKEDQYDAVIDGGGGTLMPGLSDVHAHISLCRPPAELENLRTWDYIGAVSAAEAERYLMRGFTTVRDVAGPVFGLKRAIDEGLTKGPRIFACGPGLAQTAGHGDMRTWNSKSTYFVGDRFNMQDLGYFWLADGVAEVQKACRESLSKQAAFIKMCTGGGVTSLTDPLDSVQYTPEEVRAAVLEAERYGTYVAAHVHTDEGLNVALDSGVKSLEHALLIKEDTVKKLVDKGAYVCPQSFIVSQPIEGNPVFADPIQKAKMLRAKEGAVHAFTWFKKYGAKVTWGTDMFGDRSAYDNTNLEFGTRAQYYSNVEQLQQVTSINGELLALSNLKHPYPGAKLGVIEAEAYADLLIVDGNPLDDILLMQDYENNFKLIMKDGKVYKNTL